MTKNKKKYIIIFRRVNKKYMTKYLFIFRQGFSKKLY